MADWRWLLKGISAAAVVAALFVPAALASEHARRPVRVKVSMLPLRKAQLGGVASSLSLAHDSGTVPDLPAGTLNPLLWTSSIHTFLSLDSSYLQKLGWVGGYTLDYGDAFSGCKCVTEIRTSVQRFKTRLGARKILGGSKSMMRRCCAPMPFQPSDVGPGTSATQGGSYVADPFALSLSDYQIAYGPAGRYGELGQEIQWYSSANEAAFRSAYDEALSIALWKPFTGGTPITYVNLDNIGQGDRAAILTLTIGNPTPGTTDYLAFIALSDGKATNVVQAESQSQISPSNLQTLAQSMVTRLDAGPTG